MEVLILLTLMGILWQISSRRWKRRFLAPIALLLAAYLAITSPLGITLANQGLVAFVPPDSGEPVDAIVLLGRGENVRNRRMEIAEQLWRDQRSPKIFASGMLDAEFITEQLTANGIPATTISGEWCSQSTEENALFTSAVLHPQGIRKILLITDPPHLWRATLSFQGLGFTVIPYASPLPSQWSTKRQALSLLREYGGLAYYALTHRFRQRSAAELEHPPTEIIHKLRTWNCQV